MVLLIRRPAAIVTWREEGDISMKKLVLATGILQTVWSGMAEHGVIEIPGMPSEQLRVSC